jgi:hypothetical protein
MLRISKWIGKDDWKLVEEYLRITPDDLLLNLNESSNLKIIGRTIVDEEPGVVVFDLSPDTSKCTTVGRFKMYHPGGIV